MSTTIRKFRRLFCGGITLGFALGGMSCNPFEQPPPAPFTAPAVEMRLTHFSGTPLSGPTTRPMADTRPGEALALKVTFLALERMPAAAGVPLGASARLVAASGGDVVLPAARLTREARLLDLQNAAEFSAKAGADATGRTATIATGIGALPAGATATTVVSGVSETADPDAGGPAPRRIELDVSRLDASAAAGDGTVPLEIAVVVQDWYRPVPFRSDDGPAAPGATPKTAPPPAPPVLGRETVLLDRRPAGGKDCLAIIVPLQFAGSATRAVAAIIEVTPGSDDARHVRAVARVGEDVRRSAARAAGGNVVASFGSDDASAFDIAMAALAGGGRRQALAYVAGQTDAGLCEEVAMVADDATLGRLTDTIRQRATAVSPPPGREALGWILDRAAFELLAELLGGEKMPPELGAVLSTYAGEAGRHTASLEELSKGLGARADFYNRLLAENLIYLEDNSPSSRVRAYDWLRSHNQAPAGYDPLGTPRERRVALERAAATTQP